MNHSDSGRSTPSHAATQGAAASTGPIAASKETTAAVAVTDAESHSATTTAIDDSALQTAVSASSKASKPLLAPPPPPRASSASDARKQTEIAVVPAATSSSAGAILATSASGEDDEPGWQDMPVVRAITEEDESYAVLDEEDRKRYRFRIGSSPRKGGRKTTEGATGTLTPEKDKRRSATQGNATGTHLDVDDARGFDWRSKPAGIESDESEEEAQGRGYTQIQLNEDEEAEQLHAATEYLFNDASLSPLDGPTATPQSQMATTKQLLTEGQRIAYVGLCSLLAKEIKQSVTRGPQGEDLKDAVLSADQWVASTMSRLYIHMDIEAPEQNMINLLGEHGVLAADLAPNLATIQVVDNPDFDPQALADREERQEREAREREEENEREQRRAIREAEQFELPDSANSRYDENHQDHMHAVADDDVEDEGDIGAQQSSTAKITSAASYKRTALDLQEESSSSHAGDDEADIGVLPTASSEKHHFKEHATAEEPAADETPKLSTKPLVDPNSAAQINAENLRDKEIETTAAEQEVCKTLGLTAEPQPVQPPPNALDGVTTEISTADKTITLDIRWTVLCDLFLLLTSEGNYDARSRTLLEQVAQALGLTWLDVTKFEKRIADTLEIEEGAEKLKDPKLIEERAAQSKKRRYIMMGLATVGGGLVIGLSAGLFAPLIGAGLGAALGTIGIGGTSAFLGGAGGAALITTTATLGGAQMAGRGMSKRTRGVRTFEFKALHNNKRFNCIISIPGFMNGDQDDPRLPYSVVDSVMGDLFTILWEPDMMKEMGNAISILWNETIATGVQQVLAATIAGGLVGALALPLWLTKLGYLIDNPWSNALDRASAAGLILADVLVKKQMGARPITLVAFSLGARVIYFALLELYKKKAFGLVQNVYLIGCPVSTSTRNWAQVRSVVSGRFVNAYSASDWILGYLHRATSGGLKSVCGLHPIIDVPNIDNVDITHLVPGHLAYRALMPLVLGELGFRTTADYFDEPEDLSKIPEREVVLEPTEPTDELGEPPKSSFATLFRKNTQDKPGSQPSKPPAAPRAQQDMQQSLRASAAQPGTVRSHDYDYDEDADEPTLSTDIAPPASTTPSSTEESDEQSSVVFDTESLLEELRRAGVQVKELETSLPILSPHPNKSPSGERPSPSSGLDCEASLSRPPHLSREGSTTSLATMSNPFADPIRERTYGKPLPSITVEGGRSGVAGWADPGTSSERQPPTTWPEGKRPSLPSKDEFFNPFSVEEARDMPDQSISLTFASYDDDDIVTATPASQLGRPSSSLTRDSGSQNGNVPLTDAKNPWS